MPRIIVVVVEHTTPAHSASQPHLPSIGAPERFETLAASLPAMQRHEKRERAEPFGCTNADHVDRAQQVGKPQHTTTEQCIHAWFVQEQQCQLWQPHGETDHAHHRTTTNYITTSTSTHSTNWCDHTGSQVSCSSSSTPSHQFGGECPPIIPNITVWPSHHHHRSGFALAHTRRTRKRFGRQCSHTITNHHQQ